MKDRLQENKQVRRTGRKLILRYGKLDTRQLISIISIAYKIPKQRVAGNLRSMVYDYRTCILHTYVPGAYTVAAPTNSKIA